MDTGNTIRKVRKEYSEYLKEKHPDWAESTLKTHVSDAFYLYQYTITLSLWQCLENDETMAAAREEIYEYLKNEVKSSRAEERAKSYFKDLTMLKEFVDSKGGVKEYIGYEYDCEETIYKYAKMTYDGGNVS